MTIAFILAIILSSLIVGALGRLAIPGPDPMGVLGTIGIGLAGSLLGGLLSFFLWGRPAGIGFSILGAAVVVILYRKLVQHRPITGPDARRPPPRS
ncbi:MAG TPA: hypothetical protein VJT84_01735 [Gaiellaceae bacterium]|nr:hypothetical protein [Gaiellaceae bacterium]